jgi:uncharacterized LabA/DUF88 family protein
MMAQLPEEAQENPGLADDVDTPAKRIRVMAFIDGFNVYHSLDCCERGANEAERTKYRKYKWLDLRKLLENFIDPSKEDLTRVLYFTAYPTWNADKKLRHETYVSALRTVGVEPIFGEFKVAMVQCEVPKPTGCQEFYQEHNEKQTDVNIAVSILEFSGDYDKMLLVTADSDQVPTIKLLKKKYPEKHARAIHPVGRRSKELERVCDSSERITEAQLAAAQFSDPIMINRPSGLTASIAKPNSWRS